MNIHVHTIVYFFVSVCWDLGPCAAEGLQRDVVYLCWPIAPLGCGASANECSCAHRVTWSPNKLWWSTSIFNLWASANEYSCAHHVTSSPNKLWRSISIFNLWCAGTEEEVWGVVGGAAELPCHTAPPPQARDSVRLVLWFKDDSARKHDACAFLLFSSHESQSATAVGIRWITFLSLIESKNY